MTCVTLCHSADSVSLFFPLDLLTVPPGFKKGVDFAPKGEF